MNGRNYLCSAVIVGLLLFPAVTLGITLGQIDTFEGGTPQGWVTSSPAWGVYLGGPAGSSDHFLPVLAGVSPSEHQLQMSNQSQWSGNYLAAGVTEIAMDLKYNFGNPNIFVRIAIRESTAVGAIIGYASTTAFNLPNDDRWHHASFSLAAGSLTPIASPQPLTSDLANVVDFVILSSASPATIGDTVSTSGFDIDNIQAVPEPSPICLMVMALFGVVLTQRRLKAA